MRLLRLTFVSMVSATDKYFNILSLDGEGVESLVTAYILNKAENFAHNLTMDYDLLDVPAYGGHDQRVALKDIFNMTAGVSSSAFIAAGLSLASEEQSDRPVHFSNDLISLYEVKSPDLDQYTSARQSNYMIFTLWLIIMTVASYWYGKLNFNHVNIRKAYNILETIIEEELSSKRSNREGL